jgi:hypothetical protein
VAEHHGMDGIAGGATSVVLAHVGHATSTIRIGAGGIMLPNHNPFVIAEQFGTLDALFPGRIDLGLGRAPGADSRIAQALRKDLMRALRRASRRTWWSFSALLPAYAAAGRGGDARRYGRGGGACGSSAPACSAPAWPRIWACRSPSHRISRRLTISSSYGQIQSNLSESNIQDIINQVSFRKSWNLDSSIGSKGTSRNIKDLSDILVKLEDILQKSISSSYYEINSYQQQIRRIMVVRTSFHMLTYEEQNLLEIIFIRNRYQEGLKIAEEELYYSERTIQRKIKFSIDKLKRLSDENLISGNINIGIKELFAENIIDHDLYKQQGDKTYLLRYMDIEKKLKKCEKST